MSACGLRDPSRHGKLVALRFLHVTFGSLAQAHSVSLEQHMPLYSTHGWVALNAYLVSPLLCLPGTRITLLLTKLISALILAPAVDEIPNDLKNSKIYVKLDHDQDSKSLLGGCQTINGKWENPLAHWVCKGMIPV